MNRQLFRPVLHRLLSVVAVLCSLLGLSGLAEAAASYCTATYTINNTAANQIGVYNFKGNSIISAFSAVSNNSNALAQSLTDGKLYYVDRLNNVNNVHTIDINSGTDTNIGALNPLPPSVTNADGTKTPYVVVGGTTDSAGKYYVYLNNGTFGQVQSDGTIAGGAYKAFTVQNGYTLNGSTNGDFAIDATGQTYVIAEAKTTNATATSPYLWKLDLSTGALSSPVSIKSDANTAWTTGTVNGLSIDPTNKTFLISSATGPATGGTAGLYAVDPASGIATLKIGQAGFTDLGSCPTAPDAPTLSKSFSPNPVNAATATSTLTITLGNTNKAPLYLQSPLTDTLPTTPGNMVVANPNNLKGTCTAGSVTATAGSGSVTYAAGAKIPAGGCTIIVDVQVSAYGSHVNTLAAGALDTTAGGNAAAASATLTNNPPVLSITKSNNGPWTVAQASASYTLTVSNTGPAATSGTVTVRDQLPAGITPRSISGFTTSNFTCTYADEQSNGGNIDPNVTRAVTCTSTTSIAANGSATLSIPVEITRDAVGSATNYASVGGGGDTRNGGAAPAPGANCTPTGMCTSNTVTVSDIAVPPVCAAGKQTTNLLNGTYTQYDSANGQNVTRTVPLIANASTWVNQGSGAGGAYVVDMLWAWNNGTPDGAGASPAGTISLLVNGTVYATMTTQNGNSGYAALAAQNGASVAGAEVGRGGQGNVSATVSPRAYVTLPTSLTTINTVQVRWVLGTGTDNDDDGGVQITAINACNAPPTTASVTNAVLLDSAPATVLNPNLSATDPDGTIATYTIATLPAAASGVLALNGTAVTAGQTFNANQLAQLTFDPAAGFSGNASFTYRATDNQGLTSNTSTYTIPVNRPPTTANVTNAVLVNTAPATVLNPNLSATDPDGTIATYTIATLPAAASGVLALNGTAVTAGQTFNANQLGSLTFKPAAGFSGNASFTYSATDNQGAASNTSTYTIPVNNLPTTANVTNAVLLDTAAATVLSPNLSAADTDGTIATYTIATLPAAASGVLALNGTAVTAGQTFNASQLGSLTFKPVAGFNGNASFTYSATDNQGATSNTSTYTIPVNVAPVANNDTSSTPANTAKALSITGNDTDTSPGTVNVASTVFSTSGQPNGSTLSNGNRTIAVPNEGSYTLDNNGNVTFTPVTGYSGTTTAVKYTVQDNQGATSNVASITVTVTPVATNDTATTAPSTLVNIPVLNNDLGTGKAAASVVFPATGQPTGSTVTNGGKTLTNADGTYTIKTDGTVDFTPALGKTGTLTPVLYTFKDAAGQTSNTATLTVTVSNITPPTATNDSKTTPKSTAVTLEGSTNDTAGSLPIDNASVLFPTAGQPGTATVSNGGKTLTVTGQGTYQVQTNGTVIFTPVSTFAGTTTPVYYTVNDTSGATSNAASLTVTVTNQPPTANNVTNTLLTSTSAAVALNPGVSGSDPDGTVVTYTVTTLPTAAMGTLYCNGTAIASAPSNCAPAQLSFKPNPAYNGNATFQYTVTDDNGATSNVATYTIPVNKPPVANNDSGATNPNVNVTFSVTGNDTDTVPGTVDVTTTTFDPSSTGTIGNNGKTLTVSGQGVFTLDNSGNVTFAPAAGFNNGTSTAKYTVKDNQGAVSNVATITVNVPASVDLAITKTGPAYFKPGDTLSYTLTVTNSGSAATGVSVNDTLPAGLTFASASGGGTYNAGTGKVTWTLGNVANGSTTTLTLTGTAPAAASIESSNGPTSLTNSASVAGNETEVVTNNNSASTTAQLVYPKLTKRVRNVTQNGAFGTVGTGKPGEVLEYCIDFKNYGVAVASFVVSDSVPSNTTASLSGYGAGLGLQVVRGNATTTRTSTGTDADGGSLSATALSLDLGTLAAGESGNVCFQANIR